jgi:hypothetical protein
MSQSVSPTAGILGGSFADTSALPNTFSGLLTIATPPDESELVLYEVYLAHYITVSGSQEGTNFTTITSTLQVCVRLRDTLP